MALLEINYFSNALKKITPFQMILPNDLQPIMYENNENYKREIKTLYLLHGFSGASTDWMLGSMAQELAIKYNLCIVMPSGDNSFYLDGKETGRAYATFVGEELVQYIASTFHLSAKKEDVFIGGLSMGGFGAIHTGYQFPSTFGKMFGLSSALIIYNIMNREPGFFDVIANYDYYRLVFGDLKQLENSENNPEYLLKKRIKEGVDVPPLFMACGTEDFLLENNRNFCKFLSAVGANFIYEESEGIHDWVFWNKYLEPAIQWLLS